METLPRALLSVSSVADRIKHFFVDGGSTDGTTGYLASYVANRKYSKLFLQNGKGIYSALNQGVEAALRDPAVTHVGILHGDDCLLPEAFAAYMDFVDSVPGAVYYSDIDFHNKLDKRVRSWKSGKFSTFKLNTGWMPPHTSVVVNAEVYRQIGLYDLSYGSAADYEWIVRVMSQFGKESRYFARTTLSMRTGGASSSNLTARLWANAMDGRVWASRSRVRSLIVRICKPARKIGQFILIGGFLNGRSRRALSLEITEQS